MPSFQTSSAVGADPVEQSARLRAAQYRAVLRRLPITTGGTLVLLAAALWMFWDVAPRMQLLAASALTLATGIGLLALARWRLQSPDRPVTTFDCWTLAVCLALAALCDAWLAYATLVNANPMHQTLITTTAAAVIVFGAWFLAPLRHTGMSWSLVAPLSNAAMLAYMDWRGYAGLIGLTLVATVILLVAAHFAEREFQARLRATHELANQNELVGLLLHDFEQDASDWLWETAPNGQLRRVPQRLRAWLGAESMQRGGLSLVQVLARVAVPGDRGPERLAQLFEAGAPFKDQLFAVQIDGQQRWWSLKAKPLPAGEAGAGGWRGVGSDVTAVQERDRLLSRQAREDQLTGLANRHRFAAALDALQPQDRLALLLLDLDNFKQVNDSLGHAAGDRLLVEVARRLSTVNPPGAMLARLGGDEFAFVLPGLTEAAEVEALAARVAQVLAGAILIDERELEVQTSMGAAFHPADAVGAAGLLRAADLSLYAAKAQGRGQLRCFERRLQTEAEQTLSLLADLRVAVREAQFELHYQPQLALDGNTLVGFEALVRWRHPVRGLIPPGQFIPLAESSGQILAIGDWVLQEACREAVAWAGQWPRPLNIAVNVAAQQLERSDLVQKVAAALRDSGLPAEQLELELTESSLLQDTAGATEVLNRLRGLGLRVALDDFGTGFSSLAYLRVFPIDKLKIDRSFVKPLDDPHQALSAAAIVRQVQGLAQALGMSTVAEGVETDAQLGVLFELGCDVVQGYWLAPPLTAAQARQFIELCRVQGVDAARQAFGVAAPLPAAPEPEGSMLMPLPAASRWVGL